MPKNKPAAVIAKIETPARNDQQLERQALVFSMWVSEGKTTRQIAAELKISRPTVLHDLAAESQLRADERKSVRENDLAVQLAFIDDLIERSRKLVDRPGVGALAAMSKALEMRARLLGLDAPQKLDVGPNVRVLFEVAANPGDNAGG